MSARLGVVGAHGRLGSRVAAAAEAAGWSVTLTATRAGWEETAAPDVVVDASHRSAVPEVAAYCARSGSGLVEAVSGLDERAHAALDAAASRIPVAVAPNLSRGHDLQRRALAAALAALSGDGDWSVRVTDRHPATKRDRPSATALALARACRDHGAGDVEVSSLREGDPVSDHSVALVGDGEAITIEHAVTDLRAAVGGALQAASWLLAASPGLWTMEDVWERSRDGAPRQTTTTRS